ncbi:hypothetical protein [Halorubrum ezzemoulense]|uniref:hypothetical protein n=1 Tax=Halorubrum ezzemoulense TaxID=337243 RepID=UPI0011818A3C|nr:hypothetical protein [Halorubrum ezzemoulense]
MSAKTDSHAYSELTDCDTNNATDIGYKNWSGGNWPSGYLPENKEDYYRHLNAINSGLKNGHKWQNSSYRTYELNRNLIQCLSDQLQLANWEIKKAAQIFDALQRSNMGLSSELVAFTTCANLVHRLDDNREYHPQTKPEDRDSFFERCRKDLGITRDQFQSTYGKIAHKIRNNKLNFQRHDDYEVDATIQESQRDVDASGEVWL